MISNDTDVIVALLYHMQMFLRWNLHELWVRSGDTTRYIPLHSLYGCLGDQLCRVLPALHSLTGCDITSEVGTKKAVLKAKPNASLTYFGTSPTLTPVINQNAEHYLVDVLKNSPKSP